MGSGNPQHLERKNEELWTHPVSASCNQGDVGKVTSCPGEEDDHWSGRKVKKLSKFVWIEVKLYLAVFVFT